jgi:hypothetical protein
MPNIHLKIIIYWIATSIIALDTAIRSINDILRIPCVESIIKYLGYPSCLLVMKGAWKILAVVALFSRGFPGGKEGACAGLFLIYMDVNSSRPAVGEE